MTNQEIQEWTRFTFALSDLVFLIFSNGEFAWMVYMSEALNLGRIYLYKYNELYHDHQYQPGCLSHKQYMRI